MSHEPRIPSGVAATRDLRAALGSFAASVVRLSAVDPVTTELVRLRCAHYHDCGT
jgi:hypothetical protein